MLQLLWVLLLLQLGWAVDAAVLSGRAQLGPLALQVWGFIPFLLAHLWLFVLLWLHKGPRRIGATVPASVLQDSRQPLLIVDSDGRIQTANDAASAVLDRRRSSLLGQDLSDVLGVEHKLHVKKILAARDKLRPLSEEELKRKNQVEWEKKAAGAIQTTGWCVSSFGSCDSQCVCVLGVL